MIKNTIQLGIFCSVSKSQCVTHCVGFIISVQHLVVSEKHIYCFFIKQKNILEFLPAMCQARVENVLQSVGCTEY